jgi:hypothetical protein
MTGISMQIAVTITFLLFISQVSGNNAADVDLTSGEDLRQQPLTRRSHIRVKVPVSYTYVVGIEGVGHHGVTPALAVIAKTCGHHIGYGGSPVADVALSKCGLQSVGLCSRHERKKEEWRIRKYADWGTRYAYATTKGPTNQQISSAENCFFLFIIGLFFLCFGISVFYTHLMSHGQDKGIAMMVLGGLSTSCASLFAALFLTLNCSVFTQCFFPVATR